MPQVLGCDELVPGAKQRLLRALSQLDADCLLIDVGAGVGSNTIDLFNAADARVVVMTPELTSAHNAYGFIKLALYRRLQQAIEGHPVASRLAETLGGGVFRLGSRWRESTIFLALIEGEGLGLVEPFRMLLSEYNAKLVGNMLTKEGDQNTIQSVKRMISSFLSLDVEIAATFRSNSKVRDSVNTGQPLAVGSTSDFDVAEFIRLEKDSWNKT